MNAKGGAQPNSGGNNSLNRNSGGIRKPNSLDRTKKVLAKHSNSVPKNNSAKAPAGEAAVAAKNKKAAAADQR